MHMVNDSDSGATSTPRNLGPTLLGVFSLVSYGALYGVNIELARNLSIDDFDDYNVGMSTLLLLAALAPLGLEKLALKFLPSRKERGDWAASRGFLRFSMVTSLLMSLTLAVLFAVLLESTFWMRGAGHHMAIPLIVGCLPIVSLFQLMLEFATAYGAPILAAAIYRVGFPCCLLALNGAVLLSANKITGLSAVACYVLSWCAVSIAIWTVVRAKTPPEVSNASPDFQKKKWLTQAMPLMVYSLLLTIIMHSGVIILETVRPSYPVSVYAVAMYTGAFVVLIATSTNRYYLSILSVLIERRDREGVLRLGLSRMKFVGALSGIFILVTILFGRSILRIFGEQYVAGYWAMCVIAIGAGVSTLFSIFPYSLQFGGQHRVVIARTAVATIASVGMCIPLAYKYGALGAALAYSVPYIALYVSLAATAWSQLIKVTSKQ